MRTNANDVISFQWNYCCSFCEAKRMFLDLWFMSHRSDRNEFQVLHKLIKLISFELLHRAKEERRNKVSHRSLSFSFKKEYFPLGCRAPPTLRQHYHGLHVHKSGIGEESDTNWCQASKTANYFFTAENKAKKKSTQKRIFIQFLKWLLMFFMLFCETLRLRFSICFNSAQK